MPDSELVGIKEIAVICGVTPPAVCNWITRGKLPEPTVVVGKRRRFWERSVIEEWNTLRPRHQAGRPRKASAERKPPSAGRWGHQRWDKVEQAEPSGNARPKTLLAVGPVAGPGVHLFAHCDRSIMEEALREEREWNPEAELDRLLRNRGRRFGDHWYDHWLSQWQAA